jgi:hypothetical protein
MAVHQSRPDLLDTLEDRGRAIVSGLGARADACRASGDVAGARSYEARYAEARSHQAMLVGHIDYARRPCAPQWEDRFLRGHVDFVLVVLRCMERLAEDEPGVHAAAPAPHGARGRPPRRP